MRKMNNNSIYNGVVKIISIMLIVSIVINGNLMTIFASSDSNNGSDGSVVLKNITNNKIRTSGYTIANYALEGAGTEESPYILSSAEDVKYMRDTINNGISGSGDGMINGTKGNTKGISAHYKLADSIGEDGIDLRDNWEAICPALDDIMRETDSFNGVIDGNNKKIKFASTKEGLFGKLLGRSVIKNINIEGTIDSDDNISNYIGILAGINYGKIKNCNVGGSIKVDGNGRNDKIYIGGFVSQNVGEICYSNSTASLNCRNLASSYIGGICGLNTYDRVNGSSYEGNIHDCTYIVEGTGITLIDAYDVCGGVCGRNGYANISDIVCNTNVKIESKKSIVYLGE